MTAGIETQKKLGGRTAIVSPKPYLALFPPQLIFLNRSAPDPEDNSSFVASLTEPIFPETPLSRSVTRMQVVSSSTIGC